MHSEAVHLHCVHSEAVQGDWVFWRLSPGGDDAADRCSIRACLGVLLWVSIALVTRCQGIRWRLLGQREWCWRSPSHALNGSVVDEGSNNNTLISACFNFPVIWVSYSVSLVEQRARRMLRNRKRTRRPRGSADFNEMCREDVRLVFYVEVRVVFWCVSLSSSSHTHTVAFYDGSRFVPW